MGALHPAEIATVAISLKTAPSEIFREKPTVNNYAWLFTRVDDSSLEDLLGELGRLGFAVYQTSGLAVTSEKEFLTDLQISLDLEQYAALNWAGFVSGFGVRRIFGGLRSDFLE